MDNVKAVELGWYHSAAIMEDGSLYLWGDNYSGQLGNGKFGGDFAGYDDGIDSRVPIKIEIQAESPAQINSTKAVTIRSSSLTELLPNTLYNYYALSMTDTEPLLTAENLCYITQFVTDSNGAAEIDTGETYIPEDAVIRMVPVEVTDEQSPQAAAFGDVDNSGNITIDDATMTLQVYTNQMLHVDAGVTDDDMKAMDLDEDGVVTIDDATYILAYYTAESVTHAHDVV